MILTLALRLLVALVLTLLLYGGSVGALPLWLCATLGLAVSFGSYALIVREWR